MALVFVPFLIATLALLVIHCRTRQRGTDLPLVAAVGTAVVLGLIGLEVVGLVDAAVAASGSAGI